MKREIIFKALKRDSFEWVIGSLLKYKDSCYIVPQEAINAEFSSLYWKTIKSNFRVDPKTVCQYTGLKDIHGNRIFEGDIVTFSDFRGDHTRKSSVHDGVISGWRGTIEWSDHSGWHLNKENAHNKEMLKAKESEKFNRQAPYVYYNKYIDRVKPEIIGNIHDLEVELLGN